MGIGDRIKEARLKKGFTQVELAEMIGMSKNAISNYEKGISTPQTTEILARIMNVLEVDANFIYQDEFQASKKAPEPVALTGSGASSEERIKILTETFARLGWLDESGDISDEQLRILKGVVLMLNEIFRKN